MTSVDKEIEAHRQRFFSEWTEQATSNWNSLKDLIAFEESYRRISCLGALKRDLVAQNVTGDSLNFFMEAHNDVLTSHVLAATGAWRASLQSLRSSIENVLCCLYYSEHLVELRQWSNKKYKIHMSSLLDYFAAHPDLADCTSAQSGLQQLKSEYATLSLAVHGSTNNFRMTGSTAEVLLWSDDKTKASMWAVRERKVLEGIALVLCYRFRSHLQGTKLLHVRRSLACVISKNQQKALKAVAKITIPLS